MKTTVNDYMKLFVQPYPKYTIRTTGRKNWITREGRISWKMVESHLNQEIIIGSLGRWYPFHAIIDIDSRSINEVENIREQLKMDSNNSMLCTSESPNSFHIIFHPEYNRKPPTLDLLKTSMSGICNQLGVELYPIANKCARLPFGRNQRAIDPGLELQDWQGAVHFFQKLDSYDLSVAPDGVNKNDYELPGKNTISTYREGKELLKTGLVMPSTRHDSQFKVLYYLWRLNYDYRIAVEIVFDWIMQNHNGFSKTIFRPAIIFNEINRQADLIWNKYDRVSTYPDSTHNIHNGFLTSADIPEIIKVCKGSLPRIKFLFNLVKYSYPRMHQQGGMNIHSQRLAEWSDRRSYTKRLEELEKHGIIKRSSGYLVGKRAKKIKLQWHYSESEKAVLVDHRAPMNFEQTVSTAFKARDIRAMLISSGMESGNASKFINKVCA